MNMKWLGFGVTLVMASSCAVLQPLDPPRLDEVIAGAHRTAEFAARDAHRHPQQTLEFFGLRPEHTVVEVWPGAGWYTEILAPHLRTRGKYYAAGFVVADDMSPYRRNLADKFAAKLAAQPQLYDRVTVTELGPPNRWEACPPGTADLVLTFRNVHNWMGGGYEREMFTAFYTALKPGGSLGVVEHRARPGTSLARMKKSGYVTEDYVIRAAQAAGFRLAEKSEINGNPKDDADHPEGVWTLPPSLRLGDKDRAKYIAVGESDRMTLRFVKPPGAAPGG